MAILGVSTDSVAPLLPPPVPAPPPQPATPAPQSLQVGQVAPRASSSGSSPLPALAAPGDNSGPAQNVVNALRLIQDKVATSTLPAPLHANGDPSISISAIHGTPEQHLNGNAVPAFSTADLQQAARAMDVKQDGVVTGSEINRASIALEVGTQTVETDPAKIMTNVTAGQMMAEVAKQAGW